MDAEVGAVAPQRAGEPDRHLGETATGATVMDVLPDLPLMGASTQPARPPTQLHSVPRATTFASRTHVLRDGSQVLIRQVTRADGPLLLDGFARLSDASRRSRFLTAKRELSAAEVRHFVDVDHYDHEAICALSLSDGRGVGIARYVRDGHDPESADVAVTVVDEWHGRGLGTALVEQLAERALAAGVRRFTALVDADNAAVQSMLQTVVAGVRLIGQDARESEYHIDLAHLFTGIENYATVPVQKFYPKILPKGGGTMYTLPIAAVSARQLTEQTTLSALPNAPVVAEVESRPHRRFNSLRLVAASVLQRAAVRVAPAEYLTT